jgi:hypothetical protein
VPKLLNLKLYILKFDAHNAELEEVNPHDADDAQMEDGPTTNLFVPEGNNFY